MNSNKTKQKFMKIIMMCEIEGNGCLRSKLVNLYGNNWPIEGTVALQVQYI